MLSCVSVSCAILCCFVFFYEVVLLCCMVGFVSFCFVVLSSIFVVLCCIVVLGSVACCVYLHNGWFVLCFWSRISHSGHGGSNTILGIYSE